MRLHLQLHFPARTALALAVAICTMAACNSGSRNAAIGDSTSVVGAARDTTMAAGAMSNPGGTTAAMTGTAGAAGAAMTDANIFGQLHEANANEIAEGDLASHKATAAAVKAFGRRMVTDHKAIDDQGNDLATKLGIKPTVADSSMMKAARDRLNDLQGKTGTDFDTQYIDNQVKAHQGVLDLIDRAMNATQNAQIKQMLQATRPKIASHLQAAQALQNTKAS